MHERDERYIHKFIWEMWRQETIWETKLTTYTMVNAYRHSQSPYLCPSGEEIHLSEGSMFDMNSVTLTEWQWEWWLAVGPCSWM
jgi:hypothetical protein